jgi:site-specific recombinase XerD
VEEGAKRDIRLLKAILNSAVYEKVIHENPIKTVRCSAKMETRRPRTLSPDELTRLEAVLSSDLKELVRVLLNTGLREFEALSIQWRDIRAGILEVRGEITKNGKARHIPLNAEALKALGELVSRKKETRKANTDSIFDHLVTNPLSGRTGLENRLHEAFKKAGIRGHHLGFHVFRHTFATRLIQAGVDIKTVQDLLGHSDIKTTLVYLHTTEKLKTKAVDKLDVCPHEKHPSECWSCQGMTGIIDIPQIRGSRRA